MCEQVYVTTSIPFVNARPHLGFALELVQADVIARYSRQQGQPTRFQTGTDENAFKNVLSARQQGIGTRELVDRNAQAFRCLGQALDISADDFVRTTEERHARAVHRLWQRLRPGDVYRNIYKGLYCPGCEDFFLERDLVGGYCPDHGTPPVEVAEENFFFRLSAYQEEIEHLLSTDQIRIVPAKRQREVLQFVQRGLQDISISRDARRVGGWGIPVPGDPSQVVYVWIDALINYISGPGFGAGDQWKDHWREGVRKIHVIGKNVWKFHAVYWPALLLSAGLPRPDEIRIHGFLTAEGRKISKSLGHAVDPFACIEQVGIDGVRYYLLRAVSPFDDGDFSAARLVELYNADLANGLGNLVSRLTVLAARGGCGQCDTARVPEPPAGYVAALERGEFDRALETLWAVVSQVNQEIDASRPWELLRTGACASLGGYLDRWLGELHRVAHWLTPFLPAASRRILEILAPDPIAASGPLFPRIEPETKG